MSVGNRVCCTRPDGSKYRAICACPSAQLVTVSAQKNAQLLGFKHGVTDGTDAGDATSPPLTYKSLTLSGSKVTGPIWDGYCCTQFTQTWSGTQYYQYTTSATAGPPFYPASATYLQRVTQTALATGGHCLQSASDCRTEYEPQITIVEEHSFDLPALFNHGVTLGDPDSETDALARATETAGTSANSIWETRSTGFTLTKRTVNYAVLCTDVTPGVTYDGVIPLQRREAVIGTDDDWEALASATFSFTATKQFHIEGGSLNASISDQDFIDAGYRLDPTDYGLDISENVIEPSEALDNEKGWEYEVGTNPDDDVVDVYRAP
jgi:hypothetical protein